jgi:hypothetical protein
LEFADECNKKEHLIIDYRLGFKFIKNAFHVFLKFLKKMRQKDSKNERGDESFKTISEKNTFKTI